MLTKLGIKALLLEGQSQDAKFWILHLSKSGAQFFPADDLVGKGVYETTDGLDGYVSLEIDPQIAHKAEEQIQEAFDDYLIVRTSWLFGQGGQNFVKTICRLAAERPVVQVVDDQHGSPTSTADLAAILKVTLEKNLRGIYHACNTGVCSWFEFAREAVKLAGIDGRVMPVTSEHMSRPAPRPAFSAMDCSKISRDCKLHIRHWREALRDYIAHT